MQRVSLLAVEREKIVKLSLSDAGVQISSKSEQIGSANEKIELYQYEGGRFDISFNVDDGKILSIVGFSGSGKSTVLKLISGTTFR